MKDRFALAAFIFMNMTALLFAALIAIPAQAGELQLIMFDQDGCMYCARWEAEIGPIYPKTPEALAAPLVQIDIHDPLPEDVALARPAAFTPTFVLTDDGTEVGRIEGYPGEDFFWFLLSELIDRADAADS